MPDFAGVTVTDRYVNYWHSGWKHIAGDQACLAHLLRNSFKYASKRDWAQGARDLKPVYTAASESEALDRFAEFSGKWEKRYPAIIRLWENTWAEFVPFLRFDREIRTVICTTNAIESITARLRRR